MKGSIIRGLDFNFARVNFWINFGIDLGDHLQTHFPRICYNKDELQKSTNKFHPRIHFMHCLEILQHFHQNVFANNKKCLRKRKSPMCTLSQNGYGDGTWPPDDNRQIPWKHCPWQRETCLSAEKKKIRRRGRWMRPQNSSHGHSALAKIGLLPILSLDSRGCLSLNEVLLRKGNPPFWRQILHSMEHLSFSREILYLISQGVWPRTVQLVRRRLLRRRRRRQPNQTVVRTPVLVWFFPSPSWEEQVVWPDSGRTVVLVWIAFFPLWKGHGKRGGLTTVRSNRLFFQASERRGAGQTGPWSDRWPGLTKSGVRTPPWLGWTAGYEDRVPNRATLSTPSSLGDVEKEAFWTRDSVYIIIIVFTNIIHNTVSVIINFLN